MSVTPIDQMPHLMTRLGKVRTSRIRYMSRANPWRQPAAINMPNEVLYEMQGKSIYEVACPVADIIHGVANLDHHGKRHRSTPLSMSRLYAIFECIEMINTREIMAMFDIQERQARRYMKACKLIMPHLKKHFLESADEAYFQYPIYTEKE